MNIVKKTELIKATKQIVAYNIAAETFKALRDFAKDYDGKKITKRFVNAAIKAIPHLSKEDCFLQYTKEGGVFGVFIKDRCVMYQLHGQNTVSYIANDKFTLYPDVYKPYIDNATGNLDFEQFSIAIDKKLNAIADETKDAKLFIENFDSYAKSILAMQKEVDHLADTLPYPMKGYFVSDYSRRLTFDMKD